MNAFGLYLDSFLGHLELVYPSGCCKLARCSPSPFPSSTRLAHQSLGVGFVEAESLELYLLMKLHRTSTMRNNQWCIHISSVGLCNNEVSGAPSCLIQQLFRERVGSTHSIWLGKTISPDFAMQLARLFCVQDKAMCIFSLLLAYTGLYFLSLLIVMNVRF